MPQIVLRESGQDKRHVLSPLLLLILLLGIMLIPVPSDAVEWLYTVQAGSFRLDDLAGAGKRFMLLSRQLGEKQRVDLRIEQTEKQFLVRIGQFTSAAKAQNLLKMVNRSVPGAGITKLQIDEFWKNQVLIAYDDRSFQRTRKTLESSFESAEKHRASRPTDPGEQRVDNLAEYQEVEKSEALLDEISRNFRDYKYEKASELIRQGIRRWSDRPEFYAWNGATLLDTGRPDEALVQYRKAAELMPNVPEYHAGSGFSLLNIYVDRAKQSMEAFEKALAIDPDNINAIEGLGIVYASTGQRVQAEELHKRLRQLDRDAAARLSEYIRWGIDWQR